MVKRLLIDKMKNHDKLFVSNPIYTEKITNIKTKKLMSIRLEIIEKIDLFLKSNECFKNTPFLWIGLIENFGNYEDTKVQIKKIDKRYGDLEVNIFIPFGLLNSLNMEDVKSIQLFYFNIYTKAFNDINSKFNLSINLSTIIKLYIFVTSIAITSKINSILMKKLEYNRIFVIEKLNEDLKTSNPFSGKPFSWVVGTEYYGLYDDISEVEYSIKKIDKKYDCLEFNIRLPKSYLLTLKEKTDIEIQSFYKNMYNECINRILGLE